MQATSDKTGSVGFTQTEEVINLGGIINDVTGDAYGKAGYDLFYQWGRKDAFRSIAYTSSGSGSDIIYSGTSVNVNLTIQNPTTYYSNNGLAEGNPYTPVYYNAWNATYTTYSTATDKTDGLEKTAKTVYDPCPVGYTVPPANTFTAVATGNTSVNSNGRLYTDEVTGGKVFFPFAGVRWYGSGGRDYSLNGFYWTSISLNAAKARQLRIETTAVYAIYTNTSATSPSRAVGSSIRPVREN